MDESIEKLNSLRSSLETDQIQVGELPIRLEPLLWRAEGENCGEEEIKKIMNALELIIFTVPVGEQKAAAVRLLNKARLLIQQEK